MRPARKRLARMAMATAVTTTAVAAMFAAPAAHAASATTVVKEHQWVGGCDAILYTNDNVQVSGGFYFSTNPGITEICTGWLERRYGDGSWSVISGYHTLMYPGASAYTGWYDDSGNAQARACVTAYLLDGPPLKGCTDPW